jgi:hypothetical protein
MDGDSSISTGWVSDQNSECEIQLRFGQRRRSFCRDLLIPRTKENEKLMFCCREESYFLIKNNSKGEIF